MKMNVVWRRRSVYQLGIVHLCGKINAESDDTYDKLFHFLGQKRNKLEDDAGYIIHAA